MKGWFFLRVAVGVITLSCVTFPVELRAQDRTTLSITVSGAEFDHKVQPGDSLTSIGARFGVAVAVLARSNELAPTARLKVGQNLKIDNRHIVPRALEDGVVINIPQRMLFLFRGGRMQRFYPVALGKQDWQTPVGRFRVVVKKENPIWEVPKSIQEEMQREGKVVESCVPPGPDNPLGKHWLGLSVNGYGIHGTIAPASIYQFQTHGCIRLHPDDIAEIFDSVERGTPVQLIYRRWLLALAGERIFLEVHDDIYGQQPAIEQELRQLAANENLIGRIDWQRARDIIGKREGIAREVTRED